MGEPLTFLLLFNAKCSLSQALAVGCDTVGRASGIPGLGRIPHASVNTIIQMAYLSSSLCKTLI